MLVSLQCDRSCQIAGCLFLSLVRTLGLDCPAKPPCSLPFFPLGCWLSKGIDSKRSRSMSSWLGWAYWNWIKCCIRLVACPAWPWSKPTFRAPAQNTHACRFSRSRFCWLEDDASSGVPARTRTTVRLECSRQRTDTPCAHPTFAHRGGLWPEEGGQGGTVKPASLPATQRGCGLVRIGKRTLASRCFPTPPLAATVSRHTRSRATLLCAYLSAL